MSSMPDTVQSGPLTAPILRRLASNTRNYAPIVPLSIHRREFIEAIPQAGVLHVFREKSQAQHPSIKAVAFDGLAILIHILLVHGQAR